MIDIRLLYVTVSNPQEAEKIAAQLVEDRLVACANIIPGIQSIYIWEDKIQNDQECLMILKTRADLAQRAAQKTCELHSYDTPCVLFLNVEDGAEKFLTWIQDNTLSESTE